MWYLVASILLGVAMGLILVVTQGDIESISNTLLGPTGVAMGVCALAIGIFLSVWRCIKYVRNKVHGP